VSSTKNSSITRSWIPPGYSWTNSNELFALEVETSDPDVVAFISTGLHEFEIFATKKQSLAIAAIIGRKSLRGQLEIAIWDPKLLKPSVNPLQKGTVVKAYCHGVFCLPDSGSMLVLVGRNPPSETNRWLQQSLIIEADALHVEHQTAIAEFEQRIRLEKEEKEQLYERSPDLKSVMDKFEGIGWHKQQPLLRADSLLQHLPKATLFHATSSPASDAATRLATSAITHSGWPPSRDGSYEGMFSLRVGRKMLSMVTWEPYLGLPAYPEVRWAVQRRLPRALRNPRVDQPGRPKFNSGLRSINEGSSVHGIASDGRVLHDALDELQLDQSDYRNRVDDVRKHAKRQGFDAIAWYQPYHVWNEETWGIYFDSRKLDDLALSFLDDFKSQQVHGSHGLAALLAFGLAYAHEMFHARVEASLSWLEINAQQPRYIRYQERVYQTLRETPQWLEEALANWSAWNWFNAPDFRSLLTEKSLNTEGLARVVEASLDLAPPGYKEWRWGHRAATWRTFANQLNTGNPKINATGIALPLESALAGPLPYDFQHADIPLWFLGNGVIADRLLSHPATFNVPPRRELERALKHFHHKLDVSGGKGGHQKWTGPDQRAFILPTRDPVSTGVFKTFLHHVGIDKFTYVRQVRPNL
jgi:hypothetical protein